MPLQPMPLQPMPLQPMPLLPMRQKYSRNQPIHVPQTVINDELCSDCLNIEYNQKNNHQLFTHKNSYNNNNHNNNNHNNNGLSPSTAYFDDTSSCNSTNGPILSATGIIRVNCTDDCLNKSGSMNENDGMSYWSRDLGFDSDINSNFNCHWNHNMDCNIDSNFDQNMSKDENYDFRMDLYGETWMDIQNGM